MIPDNWKVKPLEILNLISQSYGDYVVVSHGRRTRSYKVLAHRDLANAWEGYKIRILLQACAKNGLSQTQVLGELSKFKTLNSVDFRKAFKKFTGSELRSFPEADKIFVEAQKASKAFRSHTRHHDLESYLDDLRAAMEFRWGVTLAQTQKLKGIDSDLLEPLSRASLKRPKKSTKSAPKAVESL